METDADTKERRIIMKKKDFLKIWDGEEGEERRHKEALWISGTEQKIKLEETGTEHEIGNEEKRTRN